MSQASSSRDLRQKTQTSGEVIAVVKRSPSNAQLARALGARVVDNGDLQGDTFACCELKKI